MKFPGKSEDKIWKTVETGTGDTFEICLKKPSVADIMRDFEVIENYTPLRIKASVVDWRGVETEDGKPVSFSEAGLAAMITAYPQAGMRIMRMVANLFLGLSGDDLKNSGTPSTQNSADGEQKTHTSNDTSESADSPNSKKSA